MLNSDQIRDKLYKQAEKFKSACAKGEYEKAKWYYQQAYWTAYFVEVDQKTWYELFGIRGEKGVYEQEGEYPEKRFLDACDKARKARAG